MTAAPETPGSDLNDEFDELMEALRRTPGRRVAVGQRGRLGPGPDQEVEVEVVNASEDGLGVRTRAALAVGAEVAVKVSRPGSGRMLVLAGEVRWCEPAAGGAFQAGIRLHRPLTDTDLSDLAQKPTLETDR